MRRWLVIMVLLVPATVWTQTIPPSPQGLTAQFSSTCEATTCATWQLGVATSVTVSVSGAGSWTGTFKASSDGGNTYFDATMIRLSDRSTTTTVTDTGDGQYAIVNSGITHLQFRLTTWASGGANVWAIRGYGSPAPIPFTSGGGPILLSDGTAAAPAYSWASDTDTGLYRIGANNVGFSAGGTLRWDYNTARILSTIPYQGTSINLASTGVLGWSSTADPTVAADMTFARGAAKRATFGDATTGVALDASIDGTLFVKSFANADTAILKANVLTATGGVTVGTNPASAGSFRTANNASALVARNATNNGDIVIAGVNGSDVVFLSGTTSAHVQLGEGTMRIMVGGTTTSFPALLRNGAGLDLTLGDGTGVGVFRSKLNSAGTTPSVANVGANSCGTSPATIAGNDNNGVITVGATAGTQCRVTFVQTAPTARDCTVTDSTTTIATRATAVSTTATDFFGAFVAGDLVTYVCVAR